MPFTNEHFARASGEAIRQAKAILKGEEGHASKK